MKFGTIKQNHDNPERADMFTVAITIEEGDKIVSKQGIVHVIDTMNDDQVVTYYDGSPRTTGTYSRVEFDRLWESGYFSLVY